MLPIISCCGTCTADSGQSMKALLTSQKPDLVLLPSSPFAFSKKHRDELLRERTFGPNVPPRAGSRILGLSSGHASSASQPSARAWRP